MAYTDIDNPELYFQCKIYIGNGEDDRTITLDGDENMQPDMVWLKQRSEVRNHTITDSVRGGSKQVFPNLTSAEATDSGTVKSFTSDGFVIGTDNQANKDTETFVAWNWKAGTSFTNDASSTGIGTIDSTGSVNTDAGFSIGTYNGSGSDNIVGHGLGVAPDMIIVKCKSTAHDWVVYHSALGNAKILTLNATTVAQSATGWQSTSPTSTVFSIDNAANSLNQSGQSFVFYAMASKKGYSKFGSYTGNGNADGTFVYTGFSPSFVLLKETSNANNWMIFDNKRSPFNLMDDFISSDIADAESTGNGNNRMDMLSNGFKIRGSGTATNRSGSNFIYMAFAENPFTTSTGVPATAR